MRRLLFALPIIALLALAPSAFAGGWATVGLSSTPTGSEPGKPWNVEMTVLQHGRTPLSVSALPAGSSVIRLELAGYDRWSWAVNIAADKRTPLLVKLQPERRRRFPGS